MRERFLCAFLPALCGVFVAGADIEPYHAQEIKPSVGRTVTNSAPSPLSARTGAVARAGATNSGEIPLFKSQEAKLNPNGGVLFATNSVAFPRALAGVWELNIPGAAYQTERPVGESTERTLHTSPGAGFGELTIFRDGRYAWKKNGVDQKGQLAAVIPNLNADPNLTYWLMKHRRDEVYIFLPADGQELEVFGAGSNWEIARGRRIRK